MAKQIRVLVVDDSALVRQILSNGLSLDPNIIVVGTAADPYIARDKIVQLKPDVLTLDVEMPRMDGVEFLRKLMPQFPIPIVMVSSLTQKGKQITMEALEAGAVDFVTKPTTNVAQGLNAMLMALRAKVKIASNANVSHWKNKPISRRSAPSTAVNHALDESTDKVIVIGASTGGTEAIKKVITKFPSNSPGVVIVQHMPPGFTKMFSERLNQLCSMEVKEAETGDRIRQGRILVAPGAMQMEIVRSGGIYQVKCYAGEKVSGHCPSVDVVMNSAAKQVGRNAVGVMLTGMGSDGAEGMLAMHKAGARNLAQDEATSVVFGMPKVAFEKGGAEKLVPIDNIASNVISLLTGK
ncbi:MAG: chemotaxis response regulator protein-glutamate methylesterase [Deltaproteobacteria bacterium]|jgi:two-component system chemotaxis response regulator CheB|nr:chemotaxis response regulator protein-glutamate methylesterase [Deltaproteobacteria bacterium]